MGKIIAITNQKGGVGKTTTSVNLAASLAHFGKEVLVIDLDPQGNATRNLGYDVSLEDLSVYEVMMEEVDAEKVIKKTHSNHLYVMPSSINLAGIELELVNSEIKQKVLAKKIKPLKDLFDYIFIDCPPSLGLLSVNALVASDSALIPMQCEYFSMEGIVMLLNTIRIIQQNLNPNIVIEGVLLTMCDFRTKFAVEIQQDVRELFKEKVYTDGIPRNIKLVESSSKGKTIIDYDINSTGAKAYLQLAKEVMNYGK